MQKSLFLLIIIGMLTNAEAQKFREIDSVMRIYQESFQPENVHLHYDKYAAKPGETVWFKAYLMAGSQAAVKSTNLYVDVFSQSGKLLQHTVWPISNANSIGSFQIPENYSESLVQIKAYTAWMLNFDSNFIYRYQMRMLNSRLQTNNEQQVPRYEIRFYPEGGSIATNAPVNLAFKVTDQFQKPVSASGWIVSSLGDTVTLFSTVHNGMGACSFKHNPGIKYTAVWTDEFGKSYSTALPEAIDLPAVIKVVPGDSTVRCTIVAKDNKPKARYHLVAYLHQQIVYRASFFLKGGEGRIADIPTSLLPSGVLQINLFDDALLPIAERITFIHERSTNLQADILPETISFTPRAENRLTIVLPDTINGSYSLSVADAFRPTDSSYGIKSQLLLAGELRGYIHDAEWYFRGINKQAELDLVMRTNGWRKYDWLKIRSLRLPTVAVPAEKNYIQLNGAVSGLKSGEKTDKNEINLFISGKDSSMQMLSVPIDESGRFVKDNLIFFDTATVYYEVKSKKKILHSATMLSNNNFFSTPKFIGSTPLLGFGNRNLHPSMMERLAEEQKAALMARNNTLKEVTVRSKIQSRIDELNETYVFNGMFIDPVSELVFDVMNDTRALSSISIFGFLQGRVAGLQIREDLVNGAIVSWRRDATALFLNEMQVSSKVLQNIPMMDIALVKIFRPPFMGAYLGGSGGAIAVYTKKGAKAESGTLFNENLPGLKKVTLAGYSAYKEFASPDYAVFNNAEQKDFRPTLYWDPMIVTDNLNRKVEIRFYNNDVAKAFRVVLEGMNEAGKLVRVEKILSSDQLSR